MAGSGRYSGPAQGESKILKAVLVGLVAGLEILVAFGADKLDREVHGESLGQVEGTILEGGHMAFQDSLEAGKLGARRMARSVGWGEVGSHHMGKANVGEILVAVHVLAVDCTEVAEVVGSLEVETVAAVEGHLEGGR